MIIIKSCHHWELSKILVLKGFFKKWEYYDNLVKVNNNTREIMCGSEICGIMIVIKLHQLFFPVHLFTANVVSMGDMKALLDLQSKTQCWTIFVMLIIKASLNFNKIWFFVSVNRVFCSAVWVKCCIKMFQTCLLNKKEFKLLSMWVACLFLSTVHLIKSFFLCMHR